jgi:HTH-type transcriptional regulator / antitoxin MqsA
MKSHNVCPVCGSEDLTAATHDLGVIYNGRKLLVSGLEHYECSVCGADPAFPEQIKSNEKRVADAKRRSQRLLTGGEIRDIREELGLSQVEAAELFGGGANAFSKYERGEVIQSLPMDRLLRVVYAHSYLLGFLRAEYSQGLQPSAVSSAAPTFYFTQASGLAAPAASMHTVTMLQS